MDAGWQEVKVRRIFFQTSKGLFTQSYLNKFGLLPKYIGLTSCRYKVRQIQLSPANFNQYAHIIATIAFDTHEELLWVGDDYVSLFVYHIQQSLTRESIECRDVLVLIMARGWRSTRRCKLIQ